MSPRHALPFLWLAICPSVALADDAPPQTRRLLGVGFGVDGGFTSSNNEIIGALSVLPLEFRSHLAPDKTRVPLSLDVQVDLADTLFAAAVDRRLLLNVATYAHIRLPVSRRVEFAVAPGVRHTLSYSGTTALVHEGLLRLGADISNVHRTLEVSVYARPQVGVTQAWSSNVAATAPVSSWGAVLELTFVWNQIGI